MESDVKHLRALHIMDDTDAQVVEHTDPAILCNGYESDSVCYAPAKGQWAHHDAFVHISSRSEAESHVLCESRNHLQQADL